MILSATEAGGGPPLILLHGLFGAGQNWGAIRKALAPRFRVLTPDLRNHGDSPHAADMAYPSLAADVVETMDEAGIRQTAILGHSMGGKVAMALALAQPARVSRLVIADIAPVRYPSGLGAYIAAMQAVPLTPGLTRRDADAALAAAIPEAGIRAFLLQSLRFERDPPAWRLGLDELAAAMPTIVDFPAFPPGTRYDGPTLVMAGESSPYIHPDQHDLFRAFFPQARFVTIRAGHWIHAENPTGFLAALEPFLDGSG